MIEIVPLGESAVIVRMRERFDDAPEQTLDTVLRAFQQLQNAAIPGVIEFAPAYTSVTVFFDPTTVAKATETSGEVFDWLVTRIRAAVAAGADRVRHRAATQRRVRLVEIPVCYDREFALDIDDVARRAAISPEEVIRLHSAAEYRVACIGFVPGFPFLAGLPKELATTRRTAKTNSTRFCRDWWRPNGNLSATFPRRLESHRSHTIALVRSSEKSTSTFARRRACAFSQDHAR